MWGEVAGEERGESPRVAVGTNVCEEVEAKEREGIMGTNGTEGSENAAVPLAGAEGGETGVGSRMDCFRGEGGADMRRELPLDCGVCTGAGGGGCGVRLVCFDVT